MITTLICYYLANLTVAMCCEINERSKGEQVAWPEFLILLCVGSLIFVFVMGEAALERIKYARKLKR